MGTTNRFVPNVYFSKKQELLRFLYTIGISIAALLLKILALFDHKIRLGVQGRKATFPNIQKAIHPDDRTLWFHCSSLGEFEQGLPVFKALRKLCPNHKIVLTFFSPSGYEIRKNTDVADVVAYLSMDTISNAKRFLDIVHPDLTVFVKYDIWPNYLLELKKQNRNAILISALFRDSQPYFKWYGSLMRRALAAFRHIFVQDEASQQLLESIGLNDTSISGDTRYDRVFDQLSQDNTLPFMGDFKQGHVCVVIGSSWPEDETLLVHFINNNLDNGVKYVFAPHNIRPELINNLRSKIKAKSVIYSEMDGKDLSGFSVFIIDTIGLLSKIYSYADIAYVGGAMGHTGLHNILEPAVFGVPIVIGKNHKKFPEAQKMINQAGVQSVTGQEDLDKTLSALIASLELRQQLGRQNGSFIEKNKGALIQIIQIIRIYL